MPDDQPTNDVIQQQAFELMQAHADDDGVEARQAIHNFGSKSPAHAEALRQAQLLQSLAPALRDDKDSLLQSVWLWLDVHWASPKTRMWLTASASCALVLAFAFPFAETTPDPKPVAETPKVVTEYATRWKETREFTLSDGSQVWLDWRSSISELFEDDIRRVTVHGGKVAFDVVSIPARPFVVQAGDVTTEVTGTEFVVRLVTETDVEVSVMEGQVKVATEDEESALLNASELVRVRNSVIGEVMSRASEDIGRWRDGVLVYRERPLLDALEELAGYTPYSVNLTRIQGTGRRVSGVFFIDQAQDALLTVLEDQNLTFTSSSRELIIEPKPLF